MSKPHEDRDSEAAPAAPGPAPSSEKTGAPLLLVPHPARPEAETARLRRTPGSSPRVALRNVGGGVVDPGDPVDPADAGEPRLPVPAVGDLSTVLTAAATAAARGVCGAMATVLERQGSAPGTPGQKLYVSADGTCVGTVGGGAVERAVLEALLAVAADPKAQHAVRTFKLGPELGMCCGGRLVVLIEPLVALVPSLIVGAGHVATALAPLLSRLGFAVTVVDHRPAWAEGERIPNVECVTGDFDDIGRGIDPRGICLVMTHDHTLDQRAIEWALRRGFAFVGGIGSRAKAERTRQRLEAKGFPKSDRARVRMPLGLDIGSRTPEEIAVAVAAEMIAWRKRPPA
jgi:xanthine dehydrogenase accessory factor